MIKNGISQTVKQTSFTLIDLVENFIGQINLSLLKDSTKYSINI